MRYYKVNGPNGFYYTDNQPQDGVEYVQNPLSRDSVEPVEKVIKVDYEEHTYYEAFVNVLEELSDKGVDEDIYKDMWRSKQETVAEYLFQLQAVEKEIRNIDYYCSEFNVGFAYDTFIKEISIQRESDNNKLIVNYYISFKGYNFDEHHKKYETIIDLLHEMIEDSLSRSAEQQIWRADE